jgi:hypothetical protein
MTLPTNLALIALLSFHAPSLPHLWGPPKGEVSHVAGWTLRVHPDHFTGTVTCKLWRERIDYQRQAVVFRLPTRIDTRAAVYRIDDAPPVAARADEAELAGLGFALNNDDLENPSGGLVRIPAHRLASAGEVRIETTPGHAPRKFKIGGLSAALEAAGKSGCGAGDFQPAFGAGR